MLDILKSLIAIESISENEKEITDFVENLLVDSAGSLQRINNSIVWKSNWDDSRKTIALGAHLDTVPFTKEDWKVTQPCNPLELNDKIYGRGSCDMKGGAAIILDIILNKSFGDNFNLLAFFYDKEELGMPNGVTEMIEKGVFSSVDLCIIPEPTECKLNYGVFGNLNAKLTAHGIAAHSSKPKSGRSALYELLPVIEKIRTYPVKTIDGVEEAKSVNMIKGGNAINIIPDKVEAFLDYRFDPNMNEEDIKNVLSSFESDHVKTEVLGIYPGVINHPKNNPVLQRMTELVEESCIVPFWSDIGQLGKAGITAVNYGPGSIDQAHRFDEFVPIKDLYQVRKVITELLQSKNI